MDWKRKTKRSKIGPSDDSDNGQGLENNAFELGEMENKNDANNVSKQAKFRNTVQVASDKHNALKVITNVKQGASKWLSYISRRRIRKKNTVINDEDEAEKPRTGGIGLDDIHDNFITTRPDALGADFLRLQIKQQEMSIASNRALIQYFSKLGQSKNEDENLNLDFVDTLIKSGANINCSDKYGQTILHEVARAWHIDVARFLLELGANVSQGDSYGRTPLHVAAAVDYPEMVNLLIENGADKEASTREEMQTPVHYAAKNDACQSLKALIKQGCKYKLVRDYKGRTPIHVAAQLDRSETARLLLDLQAPVGVSDNNGQKAITWMITKMAPVANEALNQFRTTDRPNRKQYYYLNQLVQDRKNVLDPNSHSQTPLQVAVQFHQFQLVMHECMTRLINIMWRRFGALGAWLNLLLNFVYIVLWSVIGILVEYDERHKYNLPSQWWRIVLWICAVASTVWQIVEELREFFRSKRSHRNWVKWREREIESDRRFCHPRWPEEGDFLKQELKALEDISPKYFSDMWNIFDWICYILLFVCIVTHLVDITHHSEELARAHIRIMCVTIILLWIRLMKNARAFSLLGPFIVMLGHMMKDLVRFLFLYLEFYIPYVCAFWMIFGGDKKKHSSSEVIEVDGFQSPGKVMFSLFRLTLVDEYDYTHMKQVDFIMADILVGTWLALSAILCLNLFIALLSDTFQRVYDNAQANAVMQKAITIITIWENLSKKRRLKFLCFIEKNCSPLADYYDDDLTQTGDEDLKKVTFQIKDQLEGLLEGWKARFGSIDSGGILEDSASGQSSGSGVVTNEKFENEIHILREGIKELHVKQEDLMERLKRDMKTVKNLLGDLLGRGDLDLGDQGRRQLEHYERSSVPDSHRTDGSESRSSTAIKKLKRKRQSKIPSLVDDLLDPVQDEPSLGPSSIAPVMDISIVQFPQSTTEPHRFGSKIDGTDNTADC